MIKIYSTPWCMYCRMAKDYLKEKNIDFVELDVSIDEGARKEMLDKTKQSGVPVIEINGDLIVGFDKGAINQLLGIK